MSSGFIWANSWVSNIVEGMKKKRQRAWEMVLVLMWGPGRSGTSAWTQKRNSPDTSTLSHSSSPTDVYAMLPTLQEYQKSQWAPALWENARNIVAAWIPMSHKTLKRLSDYGWGICKGRTGEAAEAYQNTIMYSGMWTNLIISHRMTI